MIEGIRNPGQCGKRIAALALSLLMIVFAFCSALPTAAAVTQSDINNLKSQASALSGQKADLQKKLASVSGQKNSALDQKRILEQKINVLRSQIYVSEQQIQQYTQQIAQKQVELEEAQAEEARYYDLFCDRVRDMEEGGDISYWAVLFQATDFADLLDRVNVVSEVMDYDNGVMDALAAARQAVADAKAALETSKAEEEQAKAALVSQKAELDQEEAQVNSLISQLTAQSSTYAGQLEDVESDARSVEQQIKKAESDYAAQLAAAKKAEEAAAAKRAADAAAAKKAAAAAAASKNTPAATKPASTSTSTSSGSSTPAPAPAPSGGSGGYVWPCPSSYHVSCAYGWRICPFHGRELHRGIDVSASYGASILAAKSGVVVLSTYGSSYGNHVVIAHGDGTRTLYAHMSSRAGSAGQSVGQGQTIGYVGSTGSSTGNHLHFEVWTGSSSNSTTNPMQYF